MNVLTFVVIAWIVAIFTAWCFDYLPEIIREWEDKRKVQIALRAEELAREMHEPHNPETTVEMPGGSFDPDETMKLSVRKFRKNQEKEFQVVFMFDNKPPKPRRRHAKA